MDDLVEALRVIQGKRIFLTGDTGFKGSWLAFWLASVGAEVYGYALPPKTETDHFHLLQLKGRIHHLDGDIRDRDRLEDYFRKAQPEFVFHLAAQAFVRYSYQHPKETIDTNVGGSVNLMECVRLTDTVKSLVYVTSDKCYQNQEWVWGYRENDELGGHDPYSASKAAAELIFSAYRQSYFRERRHFGSASVRAGNVIGGGDWSPDRIVPDCIRALNKNSPVVLRNPKSTRPWQHVLEPLSGYLLLAAAHKRDPERFSGSWNFGPDPREARTVENLAQGIIEQWGAGQLEIQSSNGEPYETDLLHLNSDKSRQLLKWSPRWGFQQTLQQTVVWYRDVLNGKKAADVTASQIQLYLEGAHDD